MELDKTTLSHLPVIAAILVVQLYIFIAALRLAWKDHRQEWEDFLEIFSKDIKFRANRGDGPDWLRYLNTIDRKFDTVDDKLRSYAAAALAFGLGGTILALILNILVLNRNPGVNASPDPLDLILGMGYALSGSLVGVVNNLLIVLWHRRSAQKQFDESSVSLLGGLEELADAHRPRGLMGEAIRDEISGLIGTLNSGLAQAFSQAMGDFPSVVNGLGAQVESLAGTVENQGQVIGKAVADLQEISTRVADSSARLEPAVQSLADASVALGKIPHEVQGVFAAGRDEWIEIARREQQESVKQLMQLTELAEQAAKAREEQVLETSSRLKDAVVGVDSAVRSIPEQLSKFLAEGQQVWVSLLREQHEQGMQELLAVLKQVESESESREQQMGEMTRELQGLVGDVHVAVGDIPGRLSGEVKSIADTLGIEFGREAKAHINELSAELHQEHERLLNKVEGHEAEWRNNVGSVIEEILEGVSGEVQTKLVDDLASVKGGIAETVTLLERVSDQLGQTHYEWASSQADNLAGWKEASQRIQNGASSLRGADDQLQIAVGALSQSANEIQRVATVSEQFEGTLVKSLDQVTGQYLGRLEDLHQGLGDGVAKLRDEYGLILERQASLIRKTLELVLQSQVSTDMS